MLLGVVGPLVEGVATYGPRNLLSCAISVVVSALCQVFAHTVVLAVATEMVAHTKQYPVTVNRQL